MPGLVVRSHAHRPRWKPSERTIRRKRMIDTSPPPWGDYRALDSVVYRSFPDIEAVKAWMDLNQLGRRNLSKEDRDELIRRLAAAGHRQKDIAEKVGLSKQAVSKIVNPSPQSGHEPTIKSTSAAEELEAKQQEIERLRAEKEALAERERYARREAHQRRQEARRENGVSAAYGRRAQHSRC